MRLRVGDALVVVSTKTGADMGHDRMVTRLYSLRKPAPNVAAFGRAGEGHTGQLALIFIDIPKGKVLTAHVRAGALQDHHRATLVGTRSFGKGSVQTIIPLGSNGALMLTTARYYTPSGRSIQAKGIEPDVVVEEGLPENMKKAPENMEGEANLRGHLRSEGNNSQEENGSSSYVSPDKNNDTQLQYALELVRGIRSVDTRTQQ